MLLGRAPQLLRPRRARTHRSHHKDCQTRPDCSFKKKCKTELDCATWAAGQPPGTVQFSLAFGLLRGWPGSVFHGSLIQHASGCIVFFVFR